MKCKGFGKIDLTLNQFIQTQDHNHEADAYKTKQIALRNKLKTAGETSSERLGDVFDDTCRIDPEAIQISYRNTRYIMSKRRKLQVPSTQPGHKYLHSLKFPLIFLRIYLLIIESTH